MSDADVGIQTLLRTLVEQQTALLNAQTESMRLQRVLVERLLGAQVSPAVPVTHAAPATPALPPLEPQPATKVMPTTEARAPEDRPSDDAPQLVTIVASATSSQPIADPALLETLPEPPAPSTSRGERYYHVRLAADAAPARPLSLEGLDVLRRIQAAGELGHLVLTFGPHAGETLGQIAHSDPDYVRRLATTAQRPDVRAAAARLVEALPGLPPASGRQRQQKWRAGRRRETG